MVSETILVASIAVGLVALIAPLLYLTFLSYTDDSHSPGGNRIEPEPAD